MLIAPCLLWGVRRASVVKFYSIMDTDGGPSASPRIEMASGLVPQITSRRAGGFEPIVDRLPSWQRGAGARTNTLGAPTVAKLTKPSDLQV